MENQWYTKGLFATRMEVVFLFFYFYLLMRYWFIKLQVLGKLHHTQHSVIEIGSQETRDFWKFPLISLLSLKL